jgi:2-keto-3-deoxy-L-rhamnonate aldolase RhmA
MAVADQGGTLRDRLAAGQPVLGINVRATRSADVARIAKTSGHHYLFIDTQHAIFDLETIAHMAQTAHAIGMPALVRVRSVADPDVSLLLDNGVSGIVFPDVNTAEDARRAVATARFAPLGRRSVGGAYARFDFQSMPTGELMQRFNEETLLVCMIETTAGLTNLDAIAAVPGIDVLHVGSNDLLADMGKAGKFDCPEIVEAQMRVIAAARANGKFAGCGGNRDVLRQAAAIRAGALFVTTQTDIAFMMTAASHWVRSLHEALEKTGQDSHG